jgi:hypothetical protein
MNPIQFLEILSDVPANEIWRFAVDGKFQTDDCGPDAFEAREPGCIGGIIDGLTVAIEASHKPLTTQLIRDIHTKCMKPLSSHRAEPSQYRKTNVMSNIDLSYFSMAGIGEFLINEKNRGNILVSFAVKIKDKIVALTTLPKEERKQQTSFMYKPTDILRAADFFKNFKDLETAYAGHDLTICFQPPGFDCIAAEMEIIVEYYNREISRRIGRDRKMSLITETIQDFLQLHPFRDGNNRTFVNCLLNKMLIENFNQMAIFAEPNIFEFHATNEVIAKIEEAISNADSLLKKTKNLFGYVTKSLHDKFKDIGYVFKNKMVSIIKSSKIEKTYSKRYFNGLNFYSASNNQDFAISQNDSKMLLYVSRK